LIGYHITRAALEKKIEQHAAGWLKRAATRTRRFRKAKRFRETSSIWSQVKPVYMELQGSSKCVYCERKLESVKYGKGEQDVEHFRPKASVRSWKVPKAVSGAGVAVTKPKKGTKGYYLLPYDLFNYAASCKPCNSALKSNYFPIAGAYRTTGARPESLLIEKPLLIYPIGDFDDPPEKLIRFHGVSPQPVAATGYLRDRALVTIEFFKLDDALGRKNLVRERAAVIIALFPQLQAQTSARQLGTAARRIIESYTADSAPHANCARSFVALHGAAPQEAVAIYGSAVAFIESIS